MADYFLQNLSDLAAHNPVEAEKIRSATDAALNVHIRHCNGRIAWESPEASGEFLADLGVNQSTIAPDRKLYVLYGMGDGRLLRHLLSQGFVEDILVFEPSLPWFKDILSCMDLGPVLRDARVRFLLGTDTGAYIRRIESYFKEKIDRVFYAGHFGNVVSLGIEKIPGYQDHAVKFAEAFKIAVQNLLSGDTHFIAEDAFRGLMNSVWNFRPFSTYRSVDALSGILSGQTAAIVGSGPSLKASLPYLKKRKDSLVIMASDSSLKPLLNEGIEPHFVGCLERVSATQRFFEGVQDRVRSCLVAPCLIHPQTVAAYPGRILTIHRDSGFGRWLFPKRPRYFLGQTVSHLCLQALSIMGCRRIYLFGLDCAYDPDTGASHNELAPEFILKHGEWEKQRNTGLSKIETPGYDGKPKMTQSIWFIDTFFCRDIIAANGLDVKNVLPQKYGIPITGTERIDPEALLSEELRADADLWDKMDAAFKSAVRQDVDSRVLIAESREFLSWLSKVCLSGIQELSEYGHEYNPQFAENVAGYEDLFEKLEARKRGLFYERGGLFQAILLPIIQNFILKNGYHIHNAAQEHADKSVRISHQFPHYMEWFTVVHSWCDRILFFLQKEEKNL